VTVAALRQQASDRDGDALDQLVGRLSALAHETRLRVFRRMMAAGPDGVRPGALIAELDVSPSTLSSHLGILVQAGLAKVHREGRAKHYAADIEAVRTLFGELVSNCCHGHPEICASIADLADADER